MRDVQCVGDVECVHVHGNNRMSHLVAPKVRPNAQVGHAMELATLLERVNECKVTTATNFEGHLRRIVACAELYFDAQVVRRAAVAASFVMPWRAGAQHMPTRPR